MKPYEPWGQKPKSGLDSSFGGFGTTTGPKFNSPSPKPFGNFGVTGGQKPVGSPNNGFGNFNLPTSPKPTTTSPTVFGNFGTAGGHKPNGGPGGNTFGAAGSAKPKRNFWGDMDGDGKETAWDDILGDGLLMDAMMAEQRAQRGEPPEPDDEFLIGRRPIAQRHAVSGGSSPAAAVFVAAMVMLGLFACAFLALAANLGH